MNRAARVVCLLLLTLSLDPAIAAESASASYRLSPSGASGGGSPASSLSFSLNASAAQPGTIGTSASPGFVLQSGFWSFVGSGLVPVLLTVDRNAITPDNVDLAWSGNNAPYDLYESSDCTSVFTVPFATTSANTYDDVAPPAATLVCYNVLATAPGPVPPPSR